METFLAYTDYRTLELTDTAAFLHTAGSGIDLGAAGKGAACDDAIAVYETYPISGAVVAVGGSIGLYGEKPDGSLWAIAVRDPYGETLSEQLGVIETEAVCVSTSGSYEKQFVTDGVQYHHLLDPKTGYPAESGLVSVTVLHESGMTADMLSTACFVLGAEASGPLLAAYGADAVFVGTDRSISLYGDVAFTLTAEGYRLVS